MILTTSVYDMNGLWFVLGHSGQRTPVKCAEAAWYYKVRGMVHLKSPAFGFVFVFSY